MARCDVVPLIRTTHKSSVYTESHWAHGLMQSFVIVVVKHNLPIEEFGPKAFPPSFPNTLICNETSLFPHWRLSILAQLLPILHLGELVGKTATPAKGRRSVVCHRAALRPSLRAVGALSLDRAEVNGGILSQQSK
ncbi:hypothetical protein HG530_015328 [Fusarium avenaceum]|nr:hypothetical protein HG530_015328 [Fusarium avenaceum]